MYEALMQNQEAIINMRPQQTNDGPYIIADALGTTSASSKSSSSLGLTEFPSGSASSAGGDE